MYRNLPTFMFRPGTLWLMIAATAGLATLGGCQRGEAFPARPVMLVCPWSPGGGTDRVARQFAMQLERELNVPVNVINAVGGAGVTGHTRGALAPADGYTLTLITPELNMLHWRGLTNITYQNFDPLCVVNRDDAALFVRTGAAWQSLAEITQQIQAEPRKLRASGTAFGGIWHVCLVGWLEEAGLDPGSVLWVASNGSAPSLQELIAGGVDMVCCSVPEAQTLLDAGKIRCLGVMGDARMDALADVPTFKEQGVNWSVRGWRGVALPLGVAADRRARLQQACEAVAHSDTMREFLESNGFGHAPDGAAGFARFLSADNAMYGEIFASPAFASAQRIWVGPFVFPAVLGGLLVVVAGAVFWGEGIGPPVDGRALSAGDLVPLAVVAAWVIVYCLLAETAGFVLTAGVLVAALCVWLRVPCWLATVLAAVLIPAVYTLFAVALRVPLPHGWLGW